MPIVNYRVIENRFTRIDAEIIRCHMEMHGECSYAVRFYPYWEHPSHIEAIKTGRSWNLTPQSDEGKITVTVYPRGLRDFCVTTHNEVEEMVFDDSHPLLWKYEDIVRINCNSPLTTEQALTLIDLVRNETQGWVDPFTVLNFGGDIPQLLRWAAHGSFHLGAFPLSLYPKIQTYLDSIKVNVYASLPTRPPLPVPKILFMDDDYIIADDFDVDVPEIVHKPEWFSPT